MNLTFAQPHMFWLLALLPLLVLVKWLADLRGQKLLKRAVAARLAPKLISPWGRWREWLAVGLELGGLTCFIGAMARPQLGYVEEEIMTSGRSLIMALDTSRSMLAEDMRPNRIDRTRLVMGELVKKLEGDRMGLIAFAGSAFVQAPITQDHDALLETLDQCDVDIIPRGGSNLGQAIDLAVETFTGIRKDGSEVPPEQLAAMASWKDSSHALLVFSDGEELEGEAIEAAKRAAKHNITIIAVGVGTKEGGLMPNPDLQNPQNRFFGDTSGRQGEYIKDETGKIVKSKLQEQVLVSVANETRGLYVPLLDLVKDNRVDVLLRKLDTSSSKSKTIRKAVDRYYFPLILGMVFLLSSIAVRILRQVAAPAGRRRAAQPPPLPNLPSTPPLT
jgi:Ca-activated chloride channel family protein